MTLEQLCDSIGDHLQLDLDNMAGSAPSDTVLTNQINLAKTEFEEFTWCNYQHKITLVLLAGIESYNLRDRQRLSHKVLEPKFVTLNEVTLRGPDGQKGMWSLSDLHEMHPGYQSYTSGTPTRAVVISESLILSCPPDSTAAAATNYISGPCLSDDFIAGVDDKKELTTIPSEFHKTVVYLACAYACAALISEQEGWARYNEFRRLAQEGLHRAHRRYRHRQVGPRPVRGSRNDWMNDEVRV